MRAQYCPGRGSRTGWSEDPCTGKRGRGNLQNSASGSNIKDATARPGPKGRGQLPATGRGVAALGAVESGARLGSPDGGQQTPAFCPWAMEIKDWMGAKEGPSSRLRVPLSHASSAPLPAPSPARPRAAGRTRKSAAESGNEPGAMSAAGLRDLTQEDALTAAKRSPLARYLPFQNLRRSRCPEPATPFRPSRPSPGTAASPKGLKSLPKSAVGEAGAPGRQEEAELPVPEPRSTQAGVGTACRSAGPRSAPQRGPSRPRRPLPRPARGPRRGCGARAAAPGIPGVRTGAGCAEAKNHTAAPAGPRCPASRRRPPRGRTHRWSSLT